MPDSTIAFDAAPLAVPHAHGPTRRFWLLAGAAMAERVGYFGLRALLMMYLIDVSHGGQGWGQDAAIGVYGLFTAASVLSPLVGGVLADRLFGALGAARLGAVSMFVGLLLVLSSSAAGVTIGLGLVALGTGMVRPSLYALLAGLHEGSVHRQDAAFTLFGLPLELGAFLAPLLCGTLGELVGWSWGFGAAAAALALGLGLLMVFPNGPLPGRENHTPEAPAPRAASRGARGPWITLMGLIGAFAVVTSLASARFQPSATGDGEWSLDLLQVGALAVLVPLLTPVFAWLWLHLGRQGRDLHVGTKLTLGMVLGCAGLLIAAVGMASGLAPALAVSATLVGSLLQATGILCLQPIALSAFTRLAPTSALAFSVAVWSLVTVSIADRVSGLVLDQVAGPSGGIPWMALAGAPLLIAAMAVLGRRLEPRAAP